VRVRATREGRIAHVTATGYIIDTIVPFVALPSRNALGRHVRVTNPANGKSCIAWVGDVGPWNIADDAYVFHGERPAAERGESLSGRGTNGAGIDLGDKVWIALGMRGNTDVDWEFVD
jgi:hypothetical protein